MAGNNEILHSLAENFGTPLYAYDSEQLRANAQLMLNAHKNSHVKFNFFEPANRNHIILRLIQKLGLGLTVVRPAGVFRALRLGFSPELVEFSGFGLSDTETALIHSQNILLNIASLPELDRFSLHYPQTPVGIRLDVFRTNRDKRGIRQADLLHFVDNRKVCIAGLHTYIGTNVFDSHKHIESTKLLADTLAKLEERSHSAISFLNVGGGFGYDYQNRCPFDWQSHGDEIAELANSLRLLRSRDLVFKFEVGRALVANTADLVVRILHAFEKGGRKFLVVNSNVSHLPRPVRYGFHKRFHPFMTDGYHRIDLLNNTETKKRQGSFEVAVVGNSHYSKDWLGLIQLRSFEPKKLINQLVAIRDVGAYVESMADTWADEPRPCSVVRDGRRELMVTERETYADLF